MTNFPAPGRSTSVIYDRFGRPIKSGDVVHLLGKTDIMWKVVKTSPIFDPKVPPGAVELVLQAIFVSGIPGGQPVGDLVLMLAAPDVDVAIRQEAGDGNGSTDTEPAGRDTGGGGEADPGAAGDDPPPPGPRKVN